MHLAPPTTSLWRGTDAFASARVQSMGVYMTSFRMIVAGLGAAAVFGLAVTTFAPSAEAKRKRACTDVTGVALGGTKKQAERAAKAEASASAAAFFGTNKIRVKPYKVSCSVKLMFNECTATTTACRR